MPGVLEDRRADAAFFDAISRLLGVAFVPLRFAERIGFPYRS